MITLKLSIEAMFLKWTEFCIDWFMNFFADPDYYWVEETYPNNKQKKKTVLMVTDKDTPKETKVETVVRNLIINSFNIFHKSIIKHFKSVNQLFFNKIVRFKAFDILNYNIYSKQCLNTIRIE